MRVVAIVHPMVSPTPLVLLLCAIVATEGGLRLVGSLPSQSSTQQSVLLGFLFGLPLLLVAGLLTNRRRWIGMATVMYSTVALALNLATIVQEAGRPSPAPLVLGLTLLSSVLNFLVMVFGGRFVLADGSDARPLQSPPPNPRFPS